MQSLCISESTITRKYWLKMLSSSQLTYLFLPSANKKEVYDNKVCKLVAAHLIVRNSQPTCLRMYLKEQYSIGTKNYLSNTIDAVALVTSFGSNISKNKGGGGVGDKDANKPTN